MCPVPHHFRRAEDKSYGGAFTLGGAKSFGDLLPLYDGTAFITASGGEMIFVASNYRVSDHTQSFSTLLWLMTWHSSECMGGSVERQWSEMVYIPSQFFGRGFADELD